jgi:3D-(3,5/4)-trihydroxycyclohexane-1,2-dione acylhydrolase (decyclizing)
VIAGGGVFYAGAGPALAALAVSGLPVAETQAGKGALPPMRPGRSARSA